jgi:serine/threonine protein kinase
MIGVANNSDIKAANSKSMMASNCTPASSKHHIYGSIENFEIEKQIGQGQFSQVYRARCLADSKVVALKRMKVIYAFYFLLKTTIYVIYIYVFYFDLFFT